MIVRWLWIGALVSADCPTKPRQLNSIPERVAHPTVAVVRSPLRDGFADPFHGNVMRTSSRPMCLERNHAPLAVRAAGRGPPDMHRASMSSATPVRAPRGRPCALFWLLSLVVFPRWVLNAECAVAPGRDFDPRNDGRERCRCRSDSHNSVLLRSGSWRGAGQPKGA